MIRVIEARQRRRWLQGSLLFHRGVHRRALVLLPHRREVAVASLLLPLVGVPWPPLMSPLCWFFAPPEAPFLPTFPAPFCFPAGPFPLAWLATAAAGFFFLAGCDGTAKLKL